MRAARWLELIAAAAALLSPLQPLHGQEPGTTARAARIELVRELAIGAERTGPEYEFSFVGQVAVARSGSVYVAAYEGASPQIRKYDATGRFRGAIGRQGAGPGEYRTADGMAVMGDSVLVVYDRRNGRVSLFDTSGTYRGSFPVPASLFWWQNYFAAFSDGTIGVRARTVAPGAQGRLMTSVFVRYRLNGAVADSIAVPPEELGGIALGDPDVGPRSAFAMTTVFALLPGGGIATAHTSRYRVEVAPARDRPFVIERDVEAVPLEVSEHAEWQRVARMAQAASPVTIPARKPFFRRLLADADGRIWVELYTRATRYPRSADTAIARRQTLTWQEHNAYDVFDRRGAYLGRVDLAPFSRLAAIVGNRIWVVEKDESGFRILVRYRMRFGSG